MTRGYSWCDIPAHLASACLQQCDCVQVKNLETCCGRGGVCAHPRSRGAFESLQPPAWQCRALQAPFRMKDERSRRIVSMSLERIGKRLS